MNAIAEPIVVDEVVTTENRYAIYELGEREPGVKGPVLIAETSKEGIGACLVQLADDRAAAGDDAVPIVGVLDQLNRRWITSLWRRRER